MAEAWQEDEAAKADLSPFHTSLCGVCTHVCVCVSKLLELTKSLSIA